ncbi:hypothetical protein HL667_16215 [Bradyrhizobium sp. 83012]|uniref:Uncharacterized protein n=1 Tax=Bradyrhizobium aeschynomenes TaxID=2734909 RepID=A0ABX2CFU0_9BRAD|nr:hypothetical protein [Bradyrhizobium aeschynomenes]NPU66550.1 hypothetical protein [Bradyrhizobium aeschynomenes]
MVLERISKHWPIFTAIAIAIVSLFNIGYFLPIGIHFIGIVDITNIAYSFGLVIVLILLLGPIIFGVVQESGPSVMAQLRKRGLGAKVFAALLILSAPLGLMVGHVFGFSLLLATVWAAIFSIYMAAFTYDDFVNAGLVSSKGIFFLTWAAMLLVVLSGAWVCTHQMNSTEIFEVATKERVFTNAKVLRSSSSGFLIYVNDRVAYVPLGEIKSVVALASPIKQGSPF